MGARKEVREHGLRGRFTPDTYGSSILPPSQDQGCKQIANLLFTGTVGGTSEVDGTDRLASKINPDGSSMHSCEKDFGADMFCSLLS